MVSNPWRLICHIQNRLTGSVVELVAEVVVGMVVELV